MIVLLGLMVALVNIGVIYYFWQRKIVWWEAAIPVVLSIIIGLACKTFSEMVQTTDIEYWGGWGVQSCYQESWTEWYEVVVPDYCTRTVSDGNGGTTTETYQCGSHTEIHYIYHPDSWWINDSNGNSVSIDSAEFNWLTQQYWKNVSRQDGHHNDYHRVKSGGDGYLHVSRWPGTNPTFLPMATSHTWTNKILAADKSLFHFDPVSEEDLKSNGIYDWPKIERFYRMRYVQGDSTPRGEQANKKLQEWNAKLGREKQVQMRILVFTDKQMDAAQDQEAYWMGGKKNEFIVCVGIDGKTRESKWAYIISWCEVEELKVKVRDFARSMKHFDSVELVDYMVPLVREQFQRKQFQDFDYLKVPTPTWAYWFSLIICTLVTIGVDFWAITNEQNA